MVKVKVYSTPSCPYCVMAKDYLKKHKVKFEEFDVSKDADAARDMVEKTGQMSVPVIEIGEKIIIGFDRDEIKKELKLKD